MDHAALLTAITLSEKLSGHPRLAGMKTLVDAQIDKMQADSAKEVEDLAKSKADAAAKLLADQQAQAAKDAKLATAPTSPRAIPADSLTEPPADQAIVDWSNNGGRRI
jgi:hypothetical protein